MILARDSQNSKKAFLCMMWFSSSAKDHSQQMVWICTGHWEDERSLYVPADLHVLNPMNASQFMLVCVTNFCAH